jgi:hypothetical protein
MSSTAKCPTLEVVLVTMHRAVLALPAPTSYEPLGAEEICAAVLAAAQGDEAAAERILAFPCDASAFVSPPPGLVIEPDRACPLGRYHILVVHGRAQVVRTTRPGACEQLVSVPVANADALHPLAEYVVRSAGGILDEFPCWYAAPEWLLRLITADVRTER